MYVRVYVLIYVPGDGKGGKHGKGKHRADVHDESVWSRNMSGAAHVVKVAHVDLDLKIYD